MSISLPESQPGRLLGLSAFIVTLPRFIFTVFVRSLLKKLETENEAIFGGKIKVDESYFVRRRKGKNGRGAAEKTFVHGQLKRGERIYARVIPDANGGTLVPIIERKVVPNSIVYTDS
ncbi:MAG: transposase [Paracoccaceae bacterium]